MCVCIVKTMVKKRFAYFEYVTAVTEETLSSGGRGWQTTAFLCMLLVVVGVYYAPTLYYCMNSYYSKHFSDSDNYSVVS